MTEPIAIIGMGCRYPQADGLEVFWRLMVEAGDAIGPYPGGRFPGLDAAYAEAAQGGGGIATHLGGFLPDIDRFDAAFFGISPREAAYIDPQHRLLLEVSWNALEDAGQTREKYEGSRTGVFIGLWTTDYENHIYRTQETPEFYLLTGGGRSTACGRLSFTFGFEGPSVSVDTACSSSMVAIHLACQSLRQKECDMALAGGANVILSTDVTHVFTNAGMLSRDGHCKFGDESADGFVRSEGAGVVILKRLSDAVAAGDEIYAVIRGSSVNNDGRTSGLLVTPSREGQQMMLLEAWRQAGVGGADLCYIEAHGTGTHVGDPVEVGAISDALRNTGARHRVPIGSVKTNIGHTESAAGVAGVIKTALVLHHGQIPASRLQKNPNPDIDWEGGPIEVVRQLQRLPFAVDGKPRVAGASSFGLTGTNSHMVLAEHQDDALGKDTPATQIAQDVSYYLLPITGYTQQALKQNAKNWLEFLDDSAATSHLAGICYRAGARRTHLAHRFTAVGVTVEEFRSQISAFLAGEASASPEPRVVRGKPLRIAFVAPGQGSQWDGMARDLLHENAAFRKSFTACDRAIADETGWSLIERLEGSEAAKYLAEIDFVQPALFAMSVALAAVWRSVGVQPDAVIGHSMGEAAAAHLAGVLTLEDAAAIICRRSRLMRTLSGSGSMASVELPAAEVEKWIQPFAGRVSIAAENSSGATVISGESAAVDELLEWLELKEVFCRRIKVDVASHSVLVDPILPQLHEELANLTPQPSTLPFFSTVTGSLAEGPELDASYWVRNLRERVRLSATVESLAHDGYNCFIELSPHPILVPAFENTLRSVHASSNTETAAGSASRPGVALPSLLRGNPAWAALLRSFGSFWIEGGSLDWAVLSGLGEATDHSQLAHRLGRRIHLPDYAFEPERFWPEETYSVARGKAPSSTSNLSPLLRSRTDLSSEPGTTVFDVIVEMEELPYLTDHRVGGSIVFPAAAHLETALEAASILAPGKPSRLAEVSFHNALYLSETEDHEVQLIVRRIPGRPESLAFALMGRQSLSNIGGGDWTEHSTGIIEFAESEIPSYLAGSLASQPATSQGTGETHYRKAHRSGLQYGLAFQLVESFEAATAPGALTARTHIRVEDASLGKGYLIHPALLDNCFQTMLHVRPRVAGMPSGDVYLPLSLRRLTFFEHPFALPRAESERLIAEATFTSVNPAAGTIEVELQLKTASGRLIAAVDGMIIQCVQSQGTRAVAEDLFAMSWVPLAPHQASTVAAAPTFTLQKHWLLFADSETDLSLSRAAQLAQRRAALAGRCTLVWQGECFRRLGDGERRLDLLGVDEYELPVDNEAALDTLLEVVTAEAGRISDIVDLWTLSGETDNNVLDSIVKAQHRGVKFIPTLVRAITQSVKTNPPRLWLITQAAQPVPDTSQPVQLSGATVWGLGTALTREHPELRPSLIDLSHGFDPQASSREFDRLVQIILHETQGAEYEDRIALRGDLAFAARLIPCPTQEQEEARRPLLEGEAFGVEIDRPGVLDRLQLRALPIASPAPDEVVVDVAFSGLNFIDVTKAMGVYPGLAPRDPVSMGLECSGRITSVGARVVDLHIGDEVVAISAEPARVGLLASRVALPAALVVRRPATMTLAEAAAVPIAYLTAHYSLNELARIRKDEWLLIHAGAGGVGLAAAKIAMAQGVRVIATASSPDKHAFLHEWGVEHVLQSRSLDFAEGVMEITRGRGVDVVLNSLAGDFIPKSLEVLAPYGRFIELGKRDIYEDRRVGLKAFRRNISYFAVDLASWIGERPEDAASMFREILHTIEIGIWPALPVGAFSAIDPAAPFRQMAQGRHIGKLVMQFEDLREPMDVLPSHTSEKSLFKADATYIVTGGLGGVGSTVAEWMAANGARNLVLVSRRQAGPAENEVLSRIRTFGATVEHRRIDLLDPSAVQTIVNEIANEMSPLRGIMHAAAVVDDVLMTELTSDRFDAVFGPKIRGTWNLHDATLGEQLDFFVMFSSIASIFPQPGHGSYSAANSFLDAFAGYRRNLGLPATSVNWAGWLGLGLALEGGASRSIEAYDTEGLGSFERDEALRVLGDVLRAKPVQALATIIDPDVYIAVHETISPLLRQILGNDTDKRSHTGAITNEHPVLTELASAAIHTERLQRLEELLRTETSRVLKLAPERIGANQPFGQMGIDSLMALEFIRRVNGALGLALPATAVFNYPTLTALAAQIAKRLGFEAASETSPVTSPMQINLRAIPANSNTGHDALQELSEEDALRALMEPGDPLRGR